MYRADFINHFADNPSQALKGILLLGDEREHRERPRFSPTKDWQRVPKGAACPPGLEYKMDLGTGETLARLLCQKGRALGANWGLGRKRPRVLALWLDAKLSLHLVHVAEALARIRCSR